VLPVRAIFDGVSEMSDQDSTDDLNRRINDLLDSLPNDDIEASARLVQECFIEAMTFVEADPSREVNRIGNLPFERGCLDLARLAEALERRVRRQ
jgi:hypothetical protein